MNIIMYKAQAWDLTKCKSYMQYTKKLLTFQILHVWIVTQYTQIFQGNNEAEDGGRFLWNVGVQLQVYTVSQSQRPQVVYLV